jgi:tRNA-dihydrouridine synthase
MEGITGYVFRRAYNRYFHDVDKYFMPFIDARQSGKLGTKEKHDLAPENNEGMCAVPQILANNAQSFISTAKTIAGYGYKEININLGCPSQTVVTKHKGAGALADIGRLEEFLDRVYEELDMDISIKTRIGMEDIGEFDRLLELYNRYPVCELIVHPRLRKEFYNGTPHLEVYEKAVWLSRNPLCYNGNIFTAEDYERIRQTFPETDKVMLGRGILINPGLIGELHGQYMDKETLKAFCDMVYEGYRKEIEGPKNFLFKVKELWAYLARSFTNYEKYYKKIMKADDAVSYEIAVNTLFREQELKRLYE